MAITPTNMEDNNKRCYSSFLNALFYETTRNFPRLSRWLMGFRWIFLLFGFPDIYSHIMASARWNWWLIGWCHRTYHNLPRSNRLKNERTKNWREIPNALSRCWHISSFRGRRYHFSCDIFGTYTVRTRTRSRSRTPFNNAACALRLLAIALSFHASRRLLFFFRLKRAPASTIFTQNEKREKRKQEPCWAGWQWCCCCQIWTQ